MASRMISALASPMAAITTRSAAAITGSVIVSRRGGGLGESSTGATSRVRSVSIGAPVETVFDLVVQVDRLPEWRLTRTSLPRALVPSEPDAPDKAYEKNETCSRVRAAILSLLDCASAASRGMSSSG